MVAQQLAGVDEEAKSFRPTLTKDGLRTRYTIVEGRGKNTLSLVYGQKKFGIRAVEEKFVSMIHDLNRTSYPALPRTIRGSGGGLKKR